jgi:hypothetical protein
LHFARPAEAGADASAPRGPASFFHSTAGLLGLAEHLIARLAARGGDEMLQRLAEIETRLRDEGAYWQELPPRRGRDRAPAPD